MTKYILPLVMICTCFMLANAGAEDTQSCCSAKTADTTATCHKTAAGDAHAGHGATPESGPAPHADHGTAPDATPAPSSCCSTGGGQHAQHGGTSGGMHGGQGRGAVMPDAMGLLHNHTALERKVEEIPNGVKTVTTTSDPELLAVVRRHPREMYAFYEAGGSVRPHDPMFAELARVADKVHMEFKDIENGIETIATSDDPEVVKLIRAHALKVSEFVKRGHAALHEGAPLPEDYAPTH